MTDPTTLPGWRWRPRSPLDSLANRLDSLAGRAIGRRDAARCDSRSNLARRGRHDGQAMAYRAARDLLRQTVVDDKPDVHDLHRMARLHSGCGTLVAVPDGSRWELSTLPAEHERWWSVGDDGWAYDAAGVPINLRGTFDSETAAYLAVLAVER